jgi:hypothetical protein
MIRNMEGRGILYLALEVSQYLRASAALPGGGKNHVPIGQEVG